MNLFIAILILIAVFYLGQHSNVNNSNNPIEYGLVSEKPWLLSPFNQPTTVPQRNSGRRIFDIDPQPWDIKNDPSYYLADLQQRYPNLELRSNVV